MAYATEKDMTYGVSGVSDNCDGLYNRKLDRVHSYMTSGMSSQLLRGRRILGGVTPRRVHCWRVNRRQDFLEQQYSLWLAAHGNSATARRRAWVCP
ncbi:uncharacterized protein LAESUDRAFT_728060 [Laetiporus sulphureus 93-53]|uniref:Uncharacterized protein n=1 Tax=Laetiporus sulphureus 93-53 TaxID=1314785 RepID=A0A165DCF5_9APHY|nr:uncharacterized protein LAESUDRAFT_728060 [Laetiporus sulphureus 93-53]KZT04558.1 hypothetical protein LAESUDRAFT_728060 [Laetiporus sulphureus 93-53]